MQERSKALAVLSGPWIPVASAFCAVVERATRDARVDVHYAEARGWLREYQPYALEGSLPAELATDDDEVWAAEVERRDSAVGGSV